MGETKDDCSPRGSKRAMGDKMHPAERQRQQQQQQEEEEEAGQNDWRSSPERPPNNGGAIRSPERKVLDKWRLPKEGREPSARPGLSASKRQAAAACVRVGSRVSFNTVVAAILIPSAKDLHAAARRELWWQETDYRDFRMNFIQFMRNPPAENDDLELLAADIAAEDTCEVAAEEEEKQMAVEDLPQPVMVSAIVYEDNSSTPCDAAPAGATKNGVCSWTVEGSEEKEASTATVSVRSSSSSTACADEIVESDIEARVLAAAAAAAVASLNNVVTTAPAAAAAVTASAVEVEFSPPPPAAAAPVTLIAEGASEAAAAFCSSATEQVPRPSSALPAVVCDASDYTVGDEGDGSAAAVDGGGCWEEQETNCRVPPCLCWPAAADEAERAAREEEEVEEEEEDGDDNTVRVRRSFSNLETARRLGAGQVSASTGEDPTDSDGGGEESASQSRPRALSLDGWFTCGLENGVETKSYETHDHAGRLRELVTLPPFPAMGAVTPPPQQALPSPKLDLAEAMRQLRVTFNVSVNEDGVNGKQGAGMECNADGGDGETKCHAEEKDGVMSFPSAAAPRNFSELGAVDSRSIGNLGFGSALNGLQPDFDVCVA